MIARPPRIVTVTTTPVQIRDTTKMPVAFSIYRYPSGGGTIDLGNSASVSAANGKTLTADADFTDFDQSLSRWMVASAGSIDVEVQDFEY